MSKFWIIVKDVYQKNVKTFSFWLMLLVPFLMIGFIYVVGYFASGGFDQDNLALVSKDTALVEKVKSDLKDDFSLEEMTQKEASQALEKEKIDGYLILEKKDETLSGKLISTTSLGSTSQSSIQQVLNAISQEEKMNAIGLTPEQLQEVSQGADFSYERVNFENGQEVADESNEELQYGVSFVLVILIFIVVLTYGSIIAQEIASEKGTRIMEVILSSTTAQTHFYGKIVGVILVALTQFVLYGIVAVAAWPFLKKQEIVASFLENIDLSHLLGTYLIYDVLFFFLGVLIYCVLAALCGSLVSKTEDVAKAIIPVTYLSLAGYLIGISIGTSNPQNIIVKITSFIPFLSSFTMPIRIASNTVGFWEIILSLGILGIATVGLMLFSAQMYKGNVLIYSEGGIFKSLKQSLKLLKKQKAH